jgi:hypothetical protein
MSSEDRPETCQIDEGHGPEVEHHARGRQVTGLLERTFDVPDDCPVELTRQGQDQGRAAASRVRPGSELVDQVALS